MHHVHIILALDISLAFQAECQALQSDLRPLWPFRWTYEGAERRRLSMGYRLDKKIGYQLGRVSTWSRDSRGNGPVKRKSPVRSSFLFRRLSFNCFSSDKILHLGLVSRLVQFTV